MDNQVLDALIVGGGPAGLFAAYYCTERGMSVGIVDAMPELGGQLTALYPEKEIYDVAGFPRVLAQDLVDGLVAQAKSHGHVQAFLSERVEVLRREGAEFVLKTSTAIHRSRSVIIAGGVGAFAPRKLDCPGVAEFEGKGIAYAVTNMEALRDRHVVIVGGGNSAVDWGINLPDKTKSCTIVHRREGFRANEGNMARLAATKTRVLVPYEIKEIRGDDWVREVVVYHNQTKAEEVLPADAVLMMLGFLAKLGPIGEWGLELEKNQMKVNSMMETSLPGVFACGDIVTYPGKLKLIATGFGEAAIAANMARAYTDPDAGFEPGHSSSKPR